MLWVVGGGTMGLKGSLDVARVMEEAQANATSGYLPYGTEKANLILERINELSQHRDGDTESEVTCCRELYVS